MEPYLGMITIFGFNFAPRGWALCQGQIMSIAQNTALFSLLGTTYGGDGRTTFALPDLRGRVPVGQGQGPGLSAYTIGQMAGNESETLNMNQIPAHTHTILPKAYAGTGNNADPTGAYLANTGSLDQEYYKSTDPVTTVDMASQQTGVNGGSQPHLNLQPYLAVNFCIALEGIFPSRS